jgi:hypothetical protein
MVRPDYCGVAWIARSVPADLLNDCRLHFCGRRSAFHGFIDFENSDVLFLSKNERCGECDSIANALVARRIVVVFRLYAD